MHMVLFSFAIPLFIYMPYICNDEALGQKIHLTDENGRPYICIHETKLKKES